MRVFRFDNLKVNGSDLGKPYHFVPVDESETYTEAIGFYVASAYDIPDLQSVTYTNAVLVGKEVV